VQNCRWTAPASAKLQMDCTCECKTADRLHIQVQNCRRFTPVCAKLQTVCTCVCIIAGFLYLRVHNCRIYAPVFLKTAESLHSHKYNCRRLHSHLQTCRQFSTACANLQTQHAHAQYVTVDSLLQHLQNFTVSIAVRQTTPFPFTYILPTSPLYVVR